MFFTKIAKIALWVFIVFGAIGSVVMAVQLTNAATMNGRIDGPNYWWVAPLGWVTTLVSASAVGTIVEISEHTSQTHELLWKMVYENKNSGLFVTNNPSAPMTASPSAPRTNNAGSVSKLSAIASGETPREDFWYCRDCGERNPNTAAICKGCGKYK